jgi:serine/threonine protein kinase
VTSPQLSTPNLTAYTTAEHALGDRYVVEREIGSGASASVFVAVDVKHSRRVAIKVLRPELSSSVSTQRFLREIEIAAGENILLSGGVAVAADFGLARALARDSGDDHAKAGRITETGMGLGTPHYMSPEQGVAEHEIDGRADQYSFACVLHEMVVGDPPFRRGRLLKIAQAALSGCFLPGFPTAQSGR